VLQKLTMTVWQQEECKKQYTVGSPAGITPHMLCAGMRGKDSCSVRTEEQTNRRADGKIDYEEDIDIRAFRQKYRQIDIHTDGRTHDRREDG
jgi:hypothetical protein